MVTLVLVDILISKSNKQIPKLQVLKDINIYSHFIRKRYFLVYAAIEVLKEFNFEYKLTSYADDSSFFLKNTASVETLLDTFKVFSDMSGLILSES